jgi:hypothetical protein
LASTFSDVNTEGELHRAREAAMPALVAVVAGFVAARIQLAPAGQRDRVADNGNIQALEDQRRAARP